MPLLPDNLLTLVATRKLGALATIKRDGRPQISPVNYAWHPDEATARTSTRTSLAKVANLRRDARVSLLVTAQDGWSYAVLEGHARLSPVAAARDDETVEELVTLYREIAGKEHLDWGDYRRAMVADGRLVLSVVVERAYGLHQG